MGKINIREATVIDFQSLAGIISIVKAWTCFGIGYERALKLFKEMEDTIYIAEMDKKVIGFITLRINGVGNIGAYIRMIAVAEQYRGQGIGTVLINYVSDIASKNIPNLFLICSVENVDAQHFYKKIGFEKIGVMKDLVIKGHDEILFRKNLG